LGQRKKEGKRGKKEEREGERRGGL